MAPGLAAAPAATDITAGKAATAVMEGLAVAVVAARAAMAGRPRRWRWSAARRS